MRMALIPSIALLGVLAAATVSAPSAARAEVVYPWCAYYGGSGDEGGTNCYFANERQCMEAISGNGGYCGENPMYRPDSTGRRAARGPRN